MKNNKNSVAKRLCLLFFTTTMLIGCSADGFGMNGAPQFTNASFNRVPPTVLMPAESQGGQQTKENNGRVGMIDIGNIAQGYVAASCVSPTNAKFRVEFGTAGTTDYNAYDYDLANDGTVAFFPLSMGNGSYTFTLFLNIQGNEYEYFFTQTAEVALVDEFAPFLLPNEVVNYTPESEVVQFSYTLTSHASTDLEIVQQVYYWVQNNITYDTEKANNLSSAVTYIPNPDQILQLKKGICYDYAAVVASMLRANGIPCQLIMGNVSTPQDGSVYHAWNMIYLKEQGWVAIKVPSTPDEWKRIDLTFAASGASDITQFIGDGNNYFEISVH